MRIFKDKRGMVGIEAAIVLIAFVIVAAAFSFMVVNMGLYATQRGREVIQEGIKEAGCPLTIDGSIIVRATSDGGKADAIIIPLKTMGTKWVAMWTNETVVSLMVGNKALPNIYRGVGYNKTDGDKEHIDPTSLSYDEIIGNLTSQYGPLYDQDTGKNVTGAVLVIENSNGDETLNYYEKGFLIIYLASGDEAPARESVLVEIRPEKGAPLTIEFVIPEALPSKAYVVVG